MFICEYKYLEFLEWIKYTLQKINTDFYIKKRLIYQIQKKMETVKMLKGEKRKTLASEIQNYFLITLVNFLFKLKNKKDKKLK